MTNLENIEHKIMQSVQLLSAQQQEAVLEFAVSFHPNVAAPVQHSLRDLAKLPLADRQKIISPYLLAMAEDFCNDPTLTEFSVLDSEGWDN